MKIVAFILLCYLPFLTYTHVINFDQNSLNQALHSNDYFFVYFYSKSCKQCIGTEVQFPKLENMIQNEDIGVGKVNVTLYPNLGTQYKIKKYPTLIFFDEGHPIQYKGSTSSSNQMKKWIQNYLQKRIFNIKQDDIDKKRKPYILISGYSQKQLKFINNALYDIDINAYKIKEDKNKQLKIKLYLKNNSIFQYKYKLQRIKLIDWIQQNIKTIIQPLRNSQLTEKILLNQKIPSLIIVYTENNRKNQYKFNFIEQVCQQNKHKIYCGQILQNYQNYQGAHGFFKAKNNNKSFIALVKKGMRIAYTMQQSFDQLTKASLQKFLNDALQDKIQRTVDNTPPSQIKFNYVKIISPQQLQITIKKNNYVLLNFYKEDDNTSLIFSRRYQILAQNIISDDQLKNVNILALNCGQHENFCQKQNFGYYPFLRFYINGFQIQYPKAQKLPQIPDITRYLYAKKTKNISKFQNYQQLNKVQKPIVVIQSSSLSPQLQLLAPLCDSIKIYHKVTEQKQPLIHLHHSQDIFQYQGIYDPYLISQWIRDSTQNLLIDIMKQNPDDRLAQAMRNKKPILLLMHQQKDKQRKLKTKLGLFCRKLNVCGTFFNTTSSELNYVLNWLGMNQINESQLFYINLAKDQKYLYQGNLDQISLQSLSSFMKDVKRGKIKAQSPPVKEQENKKEQQPHIVEQL